MSETESKQLKAIMMDAMNETIQANQELFYKAFHSALEDFYFLDSIKEGDDGKLVSRKDIMAVLEAE
jgi:hypothetical protein